MILAQNTSNIGHKILVDRQSKGAIAYVIVSEITEEFLYCGLVCIKGGIKKIDLVELLDLNKIYTILTPSEIHKNFTYATFADKSDHYLLARQLLD